MYEAREHLIDCADDGLLTRLSSNEVLDHPQQLCLGSSCDESFSECESAVVGAADVPESVRSDSILHSRDMTQHLTLHYIHLPSFY